MRTVTVPREFEMVTEILGTLAVSAPTGRLQLARQLRHAAFDEIRALPDSLDAWLFDLPEPEALVWLAGWLVRCVGGRSTDRIQRCKPAAERPAAADRRAGAGGFCPSPRPAPSRLREGIGG